MDHSLQEKIRNGSISNMDPKPKVLLNNAESIEETLLKE